MEKINFIFKNEFGEIIFKSDNEGSFIPQAYLFLVSELRDKLETDYEKYSEQLIELKYNKFNLNIILSIAEGLGYSVESREVHYNELNQREI